MFDEVKNNLPEGYRVVPSHPKHAVTEKGDVMRIGTRLLQFPWTDGPEDTELKITTFVEIDGNPKNVRRVPVLVSDMVKEAFPEEVRMFVTTTDSHTTAGVRPMLYNHGKGDHVSSPSCSTCYLGFEATPEELRRMLWLMAVEFSEEVDATASELVDQIHEQVMGDINYEKDS